MPSERACVRQVNAYVTACSAKDGDFETAAGARLQRVRALVVLVGKV
jgi:hypothetical protein